MANQIIGVKRRVLDYTAARYQSEDWVCGLNNSGCQKITDLTGAPADIYVIRTPVDLYVVDLAFVVTTTVAADTVAPVVRAQERDIDGVSNASTIVTITIPDGTIASAQVFPSARFAQHKVEAEHSLVLQHVTAAVDSGVADGAGILFVCLREPTPTEGM